MLARGKKIRIRHNAHLFAIFFVALVNADVAGAPPHYEFDWIRYVNSTLPDNAFGLATDAQGNSFLCGDTDGALDGSSAGQFDAFIARIDTLGNTEWIRQFGTPSGDTCTAVETTSSGQVIFGGITQGALGKDPSPQWPDAFLGRLDSKQSIEWLQQIGSPQGSRCWSIARGHSDLFTYMCGDTAGSYFGTHMGSGDGFLAKFDDDGAIVWSRQIGTTQWDNAYRVASDSHDNALIAGFTYGGLGGEPAGERDMYLAKYNADGDLLWVRQIGSTLTDIAEDITVDARNNVYLAGMTKGSIGARNQGYSDAIVMKFSAAGELLWTSQFGTPSGDRALSVRVSEWDGIIVVGSTAGHMDGSNAGLGDTFIARMNAIGGIVSLQQFGTYEHETVSAMVIQDDGSLRIGGTACEFGDNDIIDCRAFVTRFNLRCRGEITGDEIIGTGDLFRVLMQWGSCPSPPGFCTADINADGSVNVTDLLEVISNWGLCN